MSVSAALLLGMVSIAGCGTSSTPNGNQVETKNVRGEESGRIHVNSAQDNNFSSMKMSQGLADRIAAMPEVRTANVMLVGKNAYVAVQLVHAQGGVQANNNSIRSKSLGGENFTADGMTGSGRPMQGMDTGNMNGTGSAAAGDTGNTAAGLNGGRGSADANPGMTGTGGSMAGVPKSLTGTGTTGGTGMANPEHYAGNGGNGIFSGSNYVDGTRMRRDIDESMGRGSIGMRSTTPDSSGSNIISGTDVSRGVKDKIAVLVKQNNRSITNVYVSANPDFVERANVYAEQFRAGHPLRGFANELRTMVERIFPTRSGQ
ncbi:hypothetical protein C2I18_06395 [Paenibacillus sp. PK3_47]|nr:hypothetical protein C2I18_06395 [Paenibacillus sp. PK3_47]